MGICALSELWFSDICRTSVAGRMDLRRLERSAAEQGVGAHHATGRGGLGAGSPLCSLQNSDKSMKSVRRAWKGTNEEEVGIGSPRHRETVAAITQLALDIKRHRTFQKGRSDLSSPVSRELDLKYMSSAISADVALMSQRANQLSNLLSSQRDCKAEAHEHEGSGGGGQRSRAPDKRPPLPPRVSQHEQDRERKSALKHPQGNTNSPHQHPTSLALAYASPSESISTPRSHVTFQGKATVTPVFVLVHARVNVSLDLM
jgi:hypothetical protein